MHLTPPYRPPAHSIKLVEPPEDLHGHPGPDGGSGLPGSSGAGLSIKHVGKWDVEKQVGWVGRRGSGRLG